MLKMITEIMEECRITLKWALRLTHDLMAYAIDKLMSMLIGK